MLIFVRNLTYRASSKTLLDDISFEVQTGEYLTIIGPNGAAKINAHVFTVVFLHRTP